MKISTFSSISKQSLRYLYTGCLTLLISTVGITFISAQNTSLSITHSSGSKSKIKYSNGSKSFDIEYKGDLTISDDDTDIIAISDGGFFEIQKKAFGSKRKIIIEADRDGLLNKRYYIGRSEKEYVPTGESWLATILPEVVREVGLGAEKRVDRLYKKGGADAVLSEIYEIESEHVASMYYQFLLEKDLSSDEVIALLEDLDDNFDSDHYLTEILRGNERLFLSTPSSTNAYISSVASLDSDHYITEVINDIIKNENISDDQVISLLDITEELESDHYTSEVLRELIDERELTDSQSSRIAELIGDLDSDHYTTEVLKDLLDENHLSNEVLAIVTTTLDNISSDHHFADVIESVADHDMNAETLDKIIRSINDNISSDHYHMESLESILDNDNLILDINLPIILEGIDNMSSDSYASELIEEITDLDDISDDNLIKILGTISDLDSDSFKTECLENIADHISEDNTRVYKAYRNAARTIDSETFYGRAMRAID